MGGGKHLLNGAPKHTATYSIKPRYSDCRGMFIGLLNFPSLNNVSRLNRHILSLKKQYLNHNMNMIM